MGEVTGPGGARLTAEGDREAALAVEVDVVAVVAGPGNQGDGNTGKVEESLR